LKPEAHLICGSTGAGKTTYAMKLAETRGAVRLTIDEWMAALFWPDAPEPIEFPWALERVERCEAQMLALCPQFARLGRDVVLDLGFFTFEQRERVRGKATAAGFTPRLHYLPGDPEERWRRVARRNAEGGSTFALEVTRGMFDFCEDLFEAPGEEELAGAVVT